MDENVKIDLANLTEELSSLKKQLSLISQKTITGIKLQLNAWILNSEEEIDIRVESIKIEIDKLRKKLEEKYVYAKSLNVKIKSRTKLEKILFKSSAISKTKDLIKLELIRMQNQNITLIHMGMFNVNVGFKSVSLFKELNLRNNSKVVGIAKFNQNLLVLDSNAYVFELDRDSNIIKSQDLGMQCPPLSTSYCILLSLCTNYKNDIFIYFRSNIFDDCLCVFDRNLKFIKVISECGGKLIASDFYNPLYLFIQDFADKTYICNIEEKSFKEINQICYKPFDICTTFKKIFISHGTFDVCSGLKSASTFVTVLDKASYQFIETFEFKNWLYSQGLYIDQYENVWITAFKINEHKIESKFRYLLIINTNGTIIREIFLKNVGWISNFLFVENKLYFPVNSNTVKLLVLKMI